MPRRSRGHVYRKRTAAAPLLPVEGAPRPVEPTPENEPADGASEMVVAVDSVAVVTAPATYRQRIGRVPATARTSPAGSQRAARAFVTDYGYVVSELKRIGLTFGGLIVLLVIVSRFLH